MARRLSNVSSSPYPGLISRYELGKAEPSLLVLLKYAHLAGVAIEMLVDDKQELPKRLSNR
jgi:transcriptional regulator with XRE-family HTH domain